MGGLYTLPFVHNLKKKPAWSESFLKCKKIILVFVIYWVYLQVQ